MRCSRPYQEDGCSCCRAWGNYLELHQEDKEARADVRKVIDMLNEIRRAASPAVRKKLDSLDEDRRVDYIVKHFRFHESAE